jgi:hypothetical protein
LPLAPNSKLTAHGSRAVIMLQFAVAAAVSLFMAVWRWTKLKESKVRSASQPYQLRTVL